MAAVEAMPESVFNFKSSEMHIAFCLCECYVSYYRSFPLIRFSVLVKVFFLTIYAQYFTA